MKVLFTGSRQCNDYLLEQLKATIVDLYENYNDDGDDLEVIVGDAEGIDENVIKYCDHFNIKITVFGAYGRMRHETKFGQNIPTYFDYLTRDSHMVEQNPDACFAYWNGRPGGTEYTFRKAIERGILTTICAYSGDK